MVLVTTAFQQEIPAHADRDYREGHARDEHHRSSFGRLGFVERPCDRLAVRKGEVRDGSRVGSHGRCVGHRWAPQVERSGNLTASLDRHFLCLVERAIFAHPDNVLPRIKPPPLPWEWRAADELTIDGHFGAVTIYCLH